MRRTRSRRKIDLEDDVSASPNMLLINNQTPRTNAMRRRSMGTPSLASIPNTPNHVDSPNRTLNETFSPEPEEKVFSVRTLLDSVTKNKRHTSSSVPDSNMFDTPRITRATANSAKKSRTSIKKTTKESPVLVNLKKIVSKTPKNVILDTVGEFVDVVASGPKVIKSIRKHRKSSSFNDTIVSEKKNVKFHSPANMEMSTFDIDFKMQSDRKVMKRLRSFSNTEIDKDIAKIKKANVTPEKVEKAKTPGSRKKMPNFSEIHQRQFERMESITEHAARKAMRAKSLTCSPKANIKTEAVDIHEPKTVVVSKPEPEIVCAFKPELEIVQDLKPEVYPDSQIMVIETAVVQDVEPEVVDEPAAVITVKAEPVIQKQEIMIEKPASMLFHGPDPLKMEKFDHLILQSESTSISTSPIMQSPFIIEKSLLELPTSKSNLSTMTESEERRTSSLVGRSPFAVQIQESFSIPPKSPAINKRPIAISRIPGKKKLENINQTISLSRPKTPKQNLNATVSKIPQSKYNSVLTSSTNKNNAATNLNTSNVFVFKANKIVAVKPVASAPISSPIRPNVKRSKTMMAIKQRPPIPMHPAKENHVDKVKERQQKNMSLYKGRPDPAVKPRPVAPKNMIAVRTNKRFELQMKFRQMSGNK